MTAACRLTPEAREGLEHIAFYVEDWFGPKVADKVLDRLVAAFEQLARSPGIGHRREDLTHDERVRFWTVGPTLVAYRAQPKWVEILFVERGELDWERMLAKPFD